LTFGADYVAGGEAALDPYICCDLFIGVSRNANGP
jgi:hypothetical protein